MSNPVIELLEARRATRSILSDPLPEDVIDDLVESARLTPSCRNKQPWNYLFLASSEALEKGRRALAEGNSWAARAPLLVVAHTREKDGCRIRDGRAYHQFDLGMSVMNVMLAATAHDLTARPMAGFDPGLLRELFDLPPDSQPLVMLAIGRPGDDNADHLPDHFKGIEGTRTRADASEIATIL
jgi:nitroreductase